MKTPIARALTAGGIVITTLTVSPLGVAAHASLVKATIAPNAVLAAAPKTVICTFAEGVDPRGSFVRVFEAAGDGAEIDKGNSAVSFSNAKQMTVGLPRLAKGRYLLVWFTVSADDGHKA